MSRFHQLTIAEVRRETPTAVTVSLIVPPELEEAFAFTPGQYLTLRATIDGEDIRRSYSICSGQGEAHLRVGIKKVEGGAFSTFANENLKAGDSLAVMAPEGRFVSALDGAGRHLIAIAAGSGITPILSIIKSLLAGDASARFTLIYGNQNVQSVMFAEELEDLKNRYLGRLTLIHVLSREEGDVPVLNGRITAERLKELAQGMADLASADEAFLCGPEGMIGEARAALLALGVPETRIRSELFTPATPRRAFKPAEHQHEAPVIATITYTLDGKTRAFPMTAADDNIVDAAARVGIDLPYSCKGGMCCTCRCQVTAGEVEMATNYSLEPWELAAGFRLACQSRPLTKEVSLNYDQL